MLCFRCGSHNPDGSEFCSQCGQKFAGPKNVQKDVASSDEIRIPSRVTDRPDRVDLKIGSQLADRYEIRDVLGSGPVGTVFRAHDLEIEVDVALKVVYPKLLQTREEKKNFLSQIRNARKINHANAVRIYDEDQDGDLVFFTMQLLEGLSLRKIINLRKEKNQQFSIRELEPIFSHICQALDRAHETKAHGDLKPANVIVLPDMLKVTDFGLLEAFPRKPFVAAQKVARGGYVYMAPELRDSERKAEPPADIYSLGVMLCEMITGFAYEGPGSGLPKLEGKNEIWQPLFVRALNEIPEKRQHSVRDFFEEFHGTFLESEAKLRGAAPPRPAPGRESSVAEAETIPPEPLPEEASRPPRAAPKRKKMPYGVGDPNDPPTVVDAEVLRVQTELSGEDDEPEKPVTEDELIEDIASESGDEDVAGVEEVDEVEDLLAPEVEEGVTQVATPTPRPAVAADSEFRVARPVDAIEPAPDIIEIVSEEILPSDPSNPRRRIFSSEPPPEAEDGPPTLPPTTSKHPPAREDLPIQDQANEPKMSEPGQLMPPYGAFSQPPFPPSYATPPPMPKPSRAPVYIGLFIFVIFAGVALYFVVDYLQALAEAARMQAQVASTKIQKLPIEPAVTAVAPTKLPKKEDPIAVSTTPPKPSVMPPKEPIIAAASKPAEKLETLPALTPKATPKPSPVIAKTTPPKKKLPTPVVHKKPIAKPEPVKAPVVVKKIDKPKKTVAAKPREPAVSKPAPPVRTTPAIPKAAATTVAATVPKVEEIPTPTTPAKTAPVTTAAAPAAACPKGMVAVPAGVSFFGTAANDPMRNFGEISLRSENMNAFCIDRYEFPNGVGRKPTIGVSWKQANALCKKRGKRLCTEQEWEYACKGKSKRRYPYGNDWNADTCNTETASGEDRPVGEAGSFPRCRSPLGVRDMSGNVSEWTSSPYSAGTTTRTYKGGSAAQPNWATRCSSRSSASPNTRKDDLGFRCCTNPK